MKVKNNSAQFVATNNVSKPKSDKKQFDQRTEMVKMRCSHSTRLLLSEMAILMDCSIADVLHHAIKNLPRTHYKLIKIEQSKLDKVI